MVGNLLYCGDNLDVLKRYIQDEAIDLVYLDPPFNTSATFDVLLTKHVGEGAGMQTRAFEDTWRWDEAAVRAYEETVEKGGQVAQALWSFRGLLGPCNMMAYLAMMAIRLKELRRVLKSTGSIYLHCDPTASHYLKVLMDAVFGPGSFRNEIVWERTNVHNDARRKFPEVSDTIFFYTKGEQYTFHTQYAPYSDAYVSAFYRHVDKDGRRYTTRDLRSPHPRPNLTYEYKGYRPHPNGWSISRERMEEFDARGLLVFPRSKGGRIRLKRYLDEMPGVPVSSIWRDLKPIHAQATERLGYPTQKPEALLERIIRAGSNEGDTVLDPFCGCGTAMITAERLHRGWVGIDANSLAIELTERRLRNTFGDAVAYSCIPAR